MRLNSRVRLTGIALAILTLSYSFFRLCSNTPTSVAVLDNKGKDFSSTTPHLDGQLITESDLKLLKDEAQSSGGSWGSSWIPTWSSSSEPSLPEPVVVQRENATFVTLCRNSDLWQIINSIKRVEDRFNRKFHYDWVFLNEEEFSEEFKELTTALVSGELKYGLIPQKHWSYPDFINLEKLEAGREEMLKSGVIYAESESYRHMCRFNSGFFFLHPLMDQYKYYWRVEPDINFFCDIDYDLFKFMRENKKTYGFVISIYEFERTIQSLWSTVKEFINKRPDSLLENNLMEFISDNNGNTYNLCHFWSNFEVADMDFWRSELYQSFFKFLDETGGFFYERWGDAPVHSIAAALFLPRDQVHFFDDLGYNHGVYSMCPISHELRVLKKCYCNPDQDFTFRGYSCGKRYYETMNMTKPENWEKYT